MQTYKMMLTTYVLLAISTLSVQAQPSQTTLKLASGFTPTSGVSTGFTGGNQSLSSFRKSDGNGNLCLGFASSTPNHVIQLEQNFPKLTFQVNSRGKDTTIMIKTPNGSFLCGDDTGGKKDASIQTNQLSAGRYEVWVGSIDPGQKWAYTLSVSEK